MNASHAHVEQTVNGIPHHLRGDAGFFRDRQIRCACSGHQNGPAPWLHIPLAERNGSGDRLKVGVWHDFLDGGEGVFRGARNQQCMTAVHDFPRDRRYLLRRFA